MDFDKELIKNTEDITGVNDPIITCQSCKTTYQGSGGLCRDCEIEGLGGYRSVDALKSIKNQ